MLQGRLRRTYIHSEQKKVSWCTYFLLLNLLDVIRIGSTSIPTWFRMFYRYTLILKSLLAIVRSD